MATTTTMGAEKKRGQKRGIQEIEGAAEPPAKSLVARPHIQHIVTGGAVEAGEDYRQDLPLGR